MPNLLFEHLIQYFLAIINFLVIHWYIWTIAAIFFLACAGAGIYVSRRHSRSGIDGIDSEDPAEFKQHLENVLAGMGFKVDAHNHIDEHNLHMIVLKDGVRVLVRAIRNKGKVGLKAIKDVLKLKDFHECHEVIVVTNATYSGRARDLSERSGVVLWNRDDLVTNLIDTGEDLLVEEGQEAVSLKTEKVKTIDEFIEENCDTCSEAVGDAQKLACKEKLKGSEGNIYCEDKDKDKEN